MKYTIKDLPKTKFAKLLDELGACAAAKRYCKGKTLKQAWANTRRGNWMDWFLCLSVDRSGFLTDAQYRYIWRNVYYTNASNWIPGYTKRCAFRAKAIREVIKVV